MGITVGEAFDNIMVWTTWRNIKNVRVWRGVEEVIKLAFVCSHLSKQGVVRRSEAINPTS